MLHLEDLDTEKFIWAVSSLNKFNISEKIDGSELVFGLDNDGKFYTSREEKNGKRYYSEKDWPNEFWTTGFRCAHKVLENNLNILKLLLNAGDSIEIEVLYGPVPNTVPYNNDGCNRIILLRNIIGKADIKKITDKINACILRGIKIDLGNIPVTEDGYTISRKDIKEQNWKIENAPIIRIENFLNKELDEKLKKLNCFLKESIYPGKSNLQISKERITKANRKLVEFSRERIQEYKLEIKKILIKQLLENRSSSFGPPVENGGWIEGLVFRNPADGFQFKLVDKEKFTKINGSNHYIQNHLRENYWKKFRNELYSICNITKDDRKVKRIYFEDYKDLANKNYNLPFEVLKKKIQELCFNYQNAILEEYKNLNSYKEYLNENNQQKVLEEFAGMRKRIMELNNKTFLATQIEHLLELILTENIEADQQKIFYNNSRRIYKKEIRKTLEYLSKISNIDYSVLKENLLGSTGKTEQNGDIDICIDIKRYDKEKLIKSLKNYISEDQIGISKGLDIIHIAIPIEGLSNNQNVQVDLILSESPEWTKFYFDSDPHNSKYKGLYRNALLRAMVSSTNITRTIENELIGRTGYVVVPKIGVQYQLRERMRSKHGGYTKTFKVLEKRNYSNSPQRIIDNILFLNAKDNDGNKIKILPENIRTFENLLELAKKYRENDIELIKDITIKILKELKYKVPEELIHVV